MNSKNSIIKFVVYAILLAVVVIGFAVGSGQEELKLKLIWMLGSLFVAAVGVFLSYKVWKN